MSIGCSTELDIPLNCNQLFQAVAVEEVVVPHMYG